MKRMVTAMSTKMPKASQGSSAYSNTGIGSGIQAAMKKKKMDDAKKKASENAGNQLKSMNRPGPLATAVKGSVKQIGKQFKEAVGNVKMNIANNKAERDAKKSTYTTIKKAGLPKPSKAP